jgi:hypothetical protein
LRFNASLDDIKKFYETGSLDDDFVRFAIKYFYADMAYNTHSQDAIELERNRRIEKEKAKKDSS